MEKLKVDNSIVTNITEIANNTSNVCILVDYDNLFHTMKRYAVDVTDEEYDICHFLCKTYGIDRIRSFRAYADFDQVKVSLRKLQEQRVQIVNVYGNNRDDKYRKNASDIELSVDAIESTYKEPNIDTYVIVTSDSDMLPIMSRLKYKGKKVHLYYVSQNVSQTVHFELCCDFSCDILKLFLIDVTKSKPDYWFDEVTKQVSGWYEDSNNSGKTYGFQWLKNDLVSILNISEQFAGEIIKAMLEEKKLISKQINNQFNQFTAIELPDMLNNTHKVKMINND